MDAGATRQVLEWDPRPTEVGDYSGPAPLAEGSAARRRRRPDAFGFVSDNCPHNVGVGVEDDAFGF
eukprot:9478335-Heterocapsa_arctica.AAC.1